MLKPRPLQYLAKTSAESTEPAKIPKMWDIVHVGQSTRDENIAFSELWQNFPMFLSHVSAILRPARGTMVSSPSLQKPCYCKSRLWPQTRRRMCGKRRTSRREMNGAFHPTSYHGSHPVVLKEVIVCIVRSIYPRFDSRREHGTNRN